MDIEGTITSRKEKRKKGKLKTRGRRNSFKLERAEVMAF